VLPIPVFRVEKNANYTTMSNYHLRDSTISFKAKGILSMFLSLPKDWSYSVSGLAAIAKEGKDGILSGLKELEAAGYLERHRYRNERGRLGDSEYVIYEIPRHVRPVPATPEQDLPKLEKPVLEKPVLDYPVQGIPVREKPMQDTPVQEKPAEEKPSQRNTEQERTDIKNTDEQIERENGSPRHRYGLYRNMLLSDAEFQSLREQFPGDYAARIDRLSEYMASCGKNYKNHLATIRSWARKDAQRNIDYHHGMYTYDGNESL
jgi:hypothetical protein